MKRQLSGMVVVITGASAGIGRALAKELHARGATLVLAARRMSVLEELNRSLDRKHLCMETDVSKPEDCQALITKALEKFGHIDTLVCNAGYGLVRPVHETSPQEMRDIFATNVFGTTDCISAAVPAMLKQEPRDGYRGQVMIVSSAAGYRGIPIYGAYAATKFAQVGLAQSMRVELLKKQIAVTSVHPIGTETDFFTTAEKVSNASMADHHSSYHQPVEVVAKKMVRAIARPRREVWPMPMAKWAIYIGQLVPGLVDWALGKYDK